MCKAIYAANVKIFMPSRLSLHCLLAQRSSAYLDMVYHSSQLDAEQSSFTAVYKCGIFVFTHGEIMAEKKRVGENRRKAAALRQSGSFNPRSDEVSSDLFRTYEFFDPNDLVQVKYEMLRRVSVESGSVTEAAAEFGLSRPSFYEAQAAFQQEGLVGLLPEKRGPRRAHKLGAEVMEFLQAAKTEDPAMSGAALADKLWKERRLRVHRRSIERALARRQKKLPAPMPGRS